MINNYPDEKPDRVDVPLYNTCPHCSFETNYVTESSNTKLFPSPGDLSICAQCEEPSEFGDDLGLIKLTPKTQAKITKRILDKIQEVKTQTKEYRI